MQLRAQLEQGLAALGLRLYESGTGRLLEYLLLLDKWNRAYNLTAIRAPDAMVTRHVLDSLSVAPYVKGERLLDVGSGAGLPGIPLAVAAPHLKVTLIESRAKKAQFLVHVTAALGLGNVDVVCQRVEQYQAAMKFDTLVARAFTTVTGFVDKAGHLCTETGRMLVMKGAHPAAELKELHRGRFVVAAVDRLRVPGLKAQRHLVVIEHRARPKRRRDDA